MTTKTTTPLEDRQRAAAQEAERLANEIADRNTARREAEDAARLEVAQTFVAVELPKLSEELRAAEAHLEALASGEDISLEQVWTAYLTVRSLSRARHDRHRVTNGVLDALAPLPQRLGMDRAHPTTEDNWATTPWAALVDRIIERRMCLASSNGTATQHALLEAATTKAAKGYED